MRLLVTSRTSASPSSVLGCSLCPIAQLHTRERLQNVHARFLTSQSKNPASGLGASAETKCQLENNITKMYRNGTIKMLPQMQPCSLLCSGLLWAHHQDTPTASLQPPEVHA